MARLEQLNQQFSSFRVSDLKWFPRPDEKCNGDYYCEKVKLLVNWFKFDRNIYDREYFEYGIEMKKIRLVKDRKTGKMDRKETPVAILDRPPIFWEHIRQEESNNHIKVEEWVFDNKDTVYSIHGIPDVMTSRLEKDKNVTYELKMIPRTRFHLFFSREDPLRDEEVNRSYKFLKTVFTQKVRYSPPENHQVALQFTKNYVYESNSIMRVPESFYDHGAFNYSLEVAPRIETWLGMYIGVKELYDGNPVLNFAAVNKLFYNAPEMSLLDYLLLIVDPETKSDEVRNARKAEIRDKNLTINKQKDKEINRLLEGIKMKCTTIWDPTKMRMVERHPQFVKLAPMDAESTTFRVKTGKSRDARTVDVPMVQVYKENRIPIHFPKLPLVIVKTGSSEIAVPMEILNVHEKPQRFKNRIDHCMLMKLIKQATLEPHIYKQKTFQILNELDFNSDELDFVKKFELCPDLKMIQCPGKVLNEPKLVNRDNALIPMTPVIRGYREKQLNVVPEKELCCAMFVLRDVSERYACVSEDDARKFYDRLMKGCEFRGMRVDQEGEPKSLLSRTENGVKKYAFYDSCPLFEGPSNFVAATHDAVRKFEDLPDKDKKTLLFIVVSDRVQNAYPYIKYHCDTLLGIPNQHIEHRTVQRAVEDETSQRIFYQIALKINAKLDGVNQELDCSELGELTLEQKEERKKQPLKMFVGIDVTHPTQGSGIDYSIASVVASINWGATRYKDMIVTQEEMVPGERPVAHGRERTDILENKFVKLLRVFAENNNNRMPDHIIVYRDGVSDSEMLKVSHYELLSLKNEVSEFLRERSCDPTLHPKYSYIVVQKRHNTRFIRQMGDRPDQTKSPEAAKLWDEELKKGDGTGLSNPHSGTIVDKIVVTKYKFDFYLASHHGAIGTSRPCHYTVMYDDSGLTKDETYKMTYELSFLSARCRKPISIPAPVHYAHLSCEKAKFKYQAYKNKQIIQKPFSTRADIEEFLQPSDKYPGMSFA